MEALQEILMGKQVQQAISNWPHPSPSSSQHPLSLSKNPLISHSESQNLINQAISQQNLSTLQSILLHKPKQLTPSQITSLLYLFSSPLQSTHHQFKPLLIKHKLPLTFSPNLYFISLLIKSTSIQPQPLNPFPSQLQSYFQTTFKQLLSQQSLISFGPRLADFYKSLIKNHTQKPPLLSTVQSLIDLQQRLKRLSSYLQVAFEQTQPAQAFDSVILTDQSVINGP